MNIYSSGLIQRPQFLYLRLSKWDLVKNVGKIKGLMQQAFKTTLTQLEVLW